MKVRVRRKNRNLKIKKHLIHTAIRSENQILVEGTKSFNVGDISSTTKWKNALIGIDCVIHCAGRAHVTKEIGNNLLDKYRLLNVDGTKRLH